MLRLIIFAIAMLALSGICNGQGVSMYGATREQDTSKTKGQQVWSAYGGSLDTMLVVIMPNGTVKKVAKNHFGATYLAGFGLGLSGSTFFVDTSNIATQYDLTLLGSDLQSVLDNGNTATGKTIELTLTGANQDHIKLIGGQYTDVLMTNDKNVTFSMGVGGDGTPLEDKWFVYDYTNSSAAIIVDDSSHVHIGAQADVDPVLSAESNNGFNKRTTVNGRFRLSSITSGSSTDSVMVINNWEVRKAAPYSSKLNASAMSNGSIQKSSAQTTTVPTQDAVSRFVDLRAATDVGSPVLWLTVDTPYANIVSGTIDTLYNRGTLGSAGNFYQPTSANRPTWNASGGMNNMPFAGFSDNAVNPSKMISGTITLDTIHTMIIVMRNNATTGAAVGTFFLGSSSSACMQYSSTGGLAISCSGGQAGAFRPGSGQYTILEINRVGRVQNYYVNGIEIPRSNVTLTTGTFNWNGLGNTFAAASQYANFNFHEMLAYDTRLSNEQLYRVRRYLMAKYTGLAGGMFAIGDSWTQGQSITTRYSALLASYLGYGEINQGITGTVLISVGTPSANNVYDRRHLMPLAPVEKQGVAIVMIGGNDVMNADKTAYSPMLYKFQLSTVVGTLLSKGWQRKQIVVANQGRFTGATTARWDSFANAALEVAREMNVMGADVSTLFGSNIANNAGIGGDGTHPTAAQCDTLAKFIRNVIYTGWSEDTATIVTGTYKWVIPNSIQYSHTGGAATYTLPPVAGNARGLIKIFNRGSGSITVNAYGGANQIFTTAATNTYTINVGDYIEFFDDGTYWKTE